MNYVDFPAVRTDIVVPAVQQIIPYVETINRNDAEFRYHHPAVDQFLKQIEEGGLLEDGVQVATNDHGKITAPARQDKVNIDEICRDFVSDVAQQKIQLPEGGTLNAGDVNVVLDIAKTLGSYEKLALELFNLYFIKLFTTGVVSIPEGLISGTLGHKIWGYREALKVKEALENNGNYQNDCGRALQRSVDVFLNLTKINILDQTDLFPNSALRMYSQDNLSAANDIGNGLNILKTAGLLPDKKAFDWKNWEVLLRIAKLKLDNISSNKENRDCGRIANTLLRMIDHMEAVKDLALENVMKLYSSGVAQ